jgi:hypothetical protein
MIALVHREDRTCSPIPWLPNYKRGKTINSEVKEWRKFVYPSMKSFRSHAANDLEYFDARRKIVSWNFEGIEFHCIPEFPK